MKKAIYIQRVLSKSEETTILNQFSGDVQIFHHPDFTLSNAFHGITKPHKLTEEQTKAINFETLQKLMAFSKNVIDGKPILEYLNWEAANIFFYSRFRIYFEFRNNFYRQKEIELLKAQFEDLTVYTSLGTDFSADFSDIKLIKTSGKTSKQWGQKIAFILVFLYRAIIGFFKIGKLKKHEILVMDRPENYQPALDLKTLKKEKANPFLGYLFSKHKGKFCITEELLNPTLREKKKNYFSYLKPRNSEAIFGETVVFSAIFRPSVWEKIKQANQHFSKNIELLKKELKTPFDLMLINRLVRLSGSNSFFLFRYFGYQRIFKKYSNLKTLATADENSPYQKCVLDAARSAGIRTVGIQHGSMHLLHPAYRYSKEEHASGATPDLTLLWGTDWYNFLKEEGNYSEEKIAVTGQLRADIIPILLNNNSSQTTDNQQFTIIYASQPQRDKQLAIRACRDVFKATEGIPNLKLIIKPHPKETDLSFFTDIAKEEDFSGNWSIENKTDLYLLISQCDALITCFSTVGVETIYFNKPLIILDHLKQDIMNFVEDGVCFPTYDSDSLRKAIFELTQNKIAVNPKAYSDYIDKKAFKIDGKTADRIFDFLQKKI